VGVAVLLFGPFLRGPSTHVRDHDGSAGDRKRVVGVRMEIQAPNDIIGVGADEGGAPTGRVPACHGHGGWVR